ncbi:MAG TPA: DUF3237 domain-containing protein [Bryobacteraceae bacterium]
MDTTPELEFLFEARVKVGVPLELGNRRIVPILKGTFEGPELRGRVLPGGADWQELRADGVVELEARYTLETDSGQLIYVRNCGIRHASPDTMADLRAGRWVDPARVYCRTVPEFETAEPELQWLTRSVFIAAADRYPSEVVLRFWRVK